MIKTAIPAEVKKRLADIEAGRWPTDPKPTESFPDQKGK